MNYMPLIGLMVLGKVSSGSNILTLLPFPCKSHGVLVERLVRELASKGHNITYLTSVPIQPLDNVQTIHIPNCREHAMKNVALTKNDGDNLLNMRNASAWLANYQIPKMGPQLCNYLFEQSQVKQLVHSSDQYDLVLGVLFLDESLLAGFAHKFKAPLVVLQPMMSNTWGYFLGGAPNPSAYIPDSFTTYGTKMSFVERMNNFLLKMAGELYYTQILLPEQDAIMRNAFGSHLPPIEVILKKTSLVLLNQHFSLAFPRPYGPNMIEVAGLHIDKPRPLSKDLQDFMDASKNGVILFSLGTNVKSELMDEHRINEILKAFSKMKQNILWKLELDLPNLPKNVNLHSWLPQPDILAHPNLKLFITQGGMLSTTEAADRGVPILGIPLMADQPINMISIEKAGYGRTIKYDDINEVTFYNAVTEVINNSTYKTKAVEMSKLMRDTPLPPLDTAVWWIEYIIRHKGASHLRLTAQHLTWYQVHQLDVVAAIFLALFITWTILRTMKTVITKIAGINHRRNNKQTAAKKEK